MTDLLDKGDKIAFAIVAFAITGYPILIAIATSFSGHSAAMGKTDQNSTPSSWPLLLVAHALVVERIEVRLAEAGLPDFATYDVVWALERAPDGRLRMNELAHELVISRSNLTRLVDRLEAQGWVTRDRDCADRRGAFAVLSEAGRALRARMWPVYQAAIEALYERYLTAEENAVLRAALKRVIVAAREDAPARKVQGRGR